MNPVILEPRINADTLSMTDGYIFYLNELVAQIDDFIFENSRAEKILYQQVKRFCKMYDKRLMTVIPILEKNYPRITKICKMTVELELDEIPISALADESHIRKCECDLKTLDNYREQTCPGNDYFFEFEEGVPFGVSLKNEIDERIFWVPCWLPENVPNPMRWLPGENHMILEPLPDNDRFMIDCLVLSVIHDEAVGFNIGHIRRKMIYRNKKLESEYFYPKDWMGIYWHTVGCDEALQNYIQIAWERFKIMETTKHKSKKTQPSPRTQKYIFHEAGGKCSICPENNFDALEIHHIKGRDITNAHKAENLICVCKNCHGMITSGQITEDEVILHKKNLKTQKTRNKQKEGAVQNLKIFGDNHGIVAHSINNISIKNPRRSTLKILPPQDSIASEVDKRNYLKYLIDIYHEFAMKEKKKNYRHAVFYQSIKREYGTTWNMIPLHRYEDVCSYVQYRIDETIEGKYRKARAINRYYTFDEYYEEYIGR